MVLIEILRSNILAFWKTPVSLELLIERSRGSMVDYLGIEFTEIGENYLVATMPVNEKTRQPIGIMHGGASCVLAETVGSTAANYAVDITTHYCVGLSIYTQHLRALSAGIVVGYAKPLHMGKSTQVWNIDLYPQRNSTLENNQLISTSRLTMAVLLRKPISP